MPVPTRRPSSQTHWGLDTAFLKIKIPVFLSTRGPGTLLTIHDCKGCVGSDLTVPELCTARRGPGMSVTPILAGGHNPGQILGA